MEWTDYNGNKHIVNTDVELSLQQPNCKYLLPCGICILTSRMDTCSLLKTDKKEV